MRAVGGRRGQKSQNHLKCQRQPVKDQHCLPAPHASEAILTVPCCLLHGPVLFALPSNCLTRFAIKLSMILAPPAANKYETGIKLTNSSKKKKKKDQHCRIRDPGPEGGQPVQSRNVLSRKHLLPLQHHHSAYSRVPLGASRTLGLPSLPSWLGVEELPFQEQEKEQSTERPGGTERKGGENEWRHLKLEFRPGDPQHLMQEAVESGGPEFFLISVLSPTCCVTLGRLLNSSGS